MAVLSCVCCVVVLYSRAQLSLAGAILDSGCLVGETSAPQPPTQPQQQGGAGLGAGAEAWVAGGEGARCTGCGVGGSGQVDSQPAQAGSCPAGAGGSSDSGASGGRGVGGGGAGGGGIRRGAPNQAMFFGPLPQWGQQLQQLLPLGAAWAGRGCIGLGTAHRGLPATACGAMDGATR